MLRRYFKLQKICLAMTALGMLPTSSWAANLVVALSPEQQSSLSSAQKTQIEEFVRSIQRRLPSNLLDGVKEDIPVSFDLGVGQALATPACGGTSSPAREQVPYGETSRSRTGFSIRLHSDFLRIISQGAERAQNYPCGHQNTFRLAEATLFHETSHVFDLRNRRGDLDPVERAAIAACDRRSDTSVEYPLDNYREYRCTDLARLTRAASDRHEFQLITHRESGSLQTRYTGRSPDPYELKSSEEQFAVNFEYFMLDPQYSCRRPLTFSYFQRLFPEAQPASPAGGCHEPLRFWSTQSQREITFRPEDVQEIHYVLAGRGTGAGRWGHTMLRLAICDSSVQPCRRDPARDVVVSFRANLGNSPMNPLTGIFGGYPSQEFIFDYQEVSREYTIDQNRDLETYRLELTPEQRRNVLAAVQQEYWEYQGDYRLVDNNCATETFNLLRSALFSRELNSESTESISPTSLLEILQRQGIVRSPRLSDDGLSRSPLVQMNSAVTAFREQGLLPNSIQSSADLNTLEPSDYQILIDRFSALSSDQKSQLAPHLIQFNLYFSHRLEKNADQIRSQWVQKSTDPQIQSLSREMNELLAKLSPLQRARVGYGTPYANEVISEPETRPTLERLVEIGKILSAAADAANPQLRQIVDTWNTQINRVLAAIAPLLGAQSAPQAVTTCNPLSPVAPRPLRRTHRQ